MPPKVVKRGAAYAGLRRTPRSTRRASKSQNPPAEPVEEPMKVEGEEEEVLEDFKAGEKQIVEEKVVIKEKEAVVERNTGFDLNFSGSVAMKSKFFSLAF